MVSFSPKTGTHSLNVRLDIVEGSEGGEPIATPSLNRREAVGRSGPAAEREYPRSRTRGNEPALGREAMLGSGARTRGNRDVALWDQIDRVRENM